MSSTRPSRLAQSGPSSSSQEGRTNTAISSRRQSRPLIIWQSLKRLFLPKQQTTAGVATTSAKMNRDASSSESTSQALLPDCIYLRDSGCVIEGVRFHGVARGSRAGRLGIGRLSSAAEARRAWHNVPDSADVLVCHSLPASSLYEDLVSRLRPKLFLYGRRLRRGSRCSPGHQTGSAENCVKFKDNVIFSNGHAGNGQACRRGVFDFYADESAPRITELSRTRPGF